MPRVPIQVDAASSKTIDDGVNSPVTVREFRLHLWAYVAGLGTIRQCVVDTGAFLSFFTKDAWALFHAKGRVAWRCHAPERTPRHQLPTFRVLGGSYRYRLGVISVQPVGLTPGVELPATDVLAQFLEDHPEVDGDPPKLRSLSVLGLHQGILRGRHLVVGQGANDTGRAWLTDDEPT